MQRVSPRSLITLIVSLAVIALPAVVAALAAAPTCAGGCHITGG